MATSPEGGARGMDQSDCSLPSRPQTMAYAIGAADAASTISALTRSPTAT